MRAKQDLVKAVDGGWHGVVVLGGTPKGVGVMGGLDGKVEA
jgi:hypothetical protein